MQMAATQPVRINDLEFDALMEESRKFDAEVPQYSVETGFSVSDSIMLNAEKLDMTLFVSNSPVTWAEIHTPSPDRVTQVCDQLEEIYLSRQLVTITTSFRVYEDMAITSLELKKSADPGYAREIPISFQKIRVTTAKTTTMPEEYAKAGETQKKAAASSSKKGGKGSGSGEEGVEVPSFGEAVQEELNSLGELTGPDGSMLYNAFCT